MALKTCKKGLHQYDTETAPRVGKSPSCPECLRAARARCRKSENAHAATARYLSSKKGRAVVARYRRSAKGRATWRKQGERRRELRAEKRAELAPAAGLPPGMKLCRKGLHQYDPATAPKVQGRPCCAECRRAARARYRQSEWGREAIARYRLSEEGRALLARYRRNRKQRGGPSGTT